MTRRTVWIALVSTAVLALAIWISIPSPFISIRDYSGIRAGMSLLELNEVVGKEADFASVRPGQYGFAVYELDYGAIVVELDESHRATELSYTDYSRVRRNINRFLFRHGYLKDDDVENVSVVELK